MNGHDAESRSHVAALSARSRGVWLVESPHLIAVWDLDTRTHIWLASPSGGLTAAGFLYAGEPLDIRRIGRWPAVGHPSVVELIDPDSPDRVLVRTTEPVNSIRRVEPAAVHELVRRAGRTLQANDVANETRRKQ